MPRVVVTDDLLADLATMMRAVEGYSSQLVSLIRGQQANNVLWSGTVALDAAGMCQLDWTVPIAAVAWWPSLAAGVTTITEGPAAGVAPTNGPGVWVFPVIGAGLLAGRVFPATGRQLTIYGTASVVAAGMLAVYSSPQPPA